MFKPHLALPLFVSMGVTARRSFVCGFFLVVTFYAAVSIYWGGLDSFTEFFSFFQTTSQAGNVFGYSHKMMANLRGFLTRYAGFFNSQTILRISFVVWGLMLGFVFILSQWAKNKMNKGWSFALASLCAILASPHLYNHDRILLMIPLVFGNVLALKVLGSVREFSWKVRIAASLVCASSLFFFSPWDLIGSPDLSIFFSLLLFIAMILFALQKGPLKSSKLDFLFEIENSKE